MFLIEDKISGAVQKFDGPLDDAINKAMSDRVPAVLWWIFGDRNDRICDVLPNKPRPKLNWPEVAKLGWFNREFKCPLCGTFFGSDFNGGLTTTTLVNQHIHRHFSMS